MVKLLTNTSLCRRCATQLSSGLFARRGFTTSVPQYKNRDPVPAFEPSSSSELDTILTSLRNEVFLPSHLKKDHRDILYKKKYNHMLADEPVINIHGEDFQLHPLDVTRRTPTKRAFKTIIPLLLQPKDWGNVSSLLQGLYEAGQFPLPMHLQKLVRKANERGEHNVILDAIRNVKKTGFKLNEKRLVWEVLFGMHMRAAESGWEEAATKKSLAQAEQILHLLEDPKHCRHKTVRGSELESDPRVQPEIVGLVLELCAVRATKHLENQDLDGKVGNYTAKVMALWRDEMLDVKEDDPYNANYKLVQWAPVWNGLRLTLSLPEREGKSVLDAMMSENVVHKAKQLEKMLDKAREIVLAKHPGDPKNTRGLKVYDELLKSTAIEALEN